MIYIPSQLDLFTFTGPKSECRFTVENIHFYTLLIGGLGLVPVLFQPILPLDQMYMKEHCDGF